jgi:hypothetical protein
MLLKQKALRITDVAGDKEQVTGSGLCFAGDPDHKFTAFDCIPMHLFKRMILCNSEQWMADLMPDLELICGKIRITSRFAKRFASTMRCIHCDYVDEVAWKQSFPNLIHISTRIIDDQRFGKSCPNIQMIQCWGTFASRSLFHGMFAITRKNILIGFTSDTMNNLVRSDACQSIRSLTFHDYNEEAGHFHLPKLQRLTMTGFRNNSDKSRKILMHSISRSQQLTELNLICTGMLAAEWINMLEKLTHCLEKVTLKVQEEVVVFMSKKMEKLRAMTILNGKLTDASVVALATMSNLEKIAIIRPDVFELSSKITAAGVLSLLRGKSRTSLKHISIESRLLKANEEIGIELSEMVRHSSLEFYKITDCKKLTWSSMTIE